VAATIQENVDIQAFTLYNMGLWPSLQVNNSNRGTVWGYFFWGLIRYPFQSLYPPKEIKDFSPLAGHSTPQSFSRGTKSSSQRFQKTLFERVVFFCRIKLKYQIEYYYLRTNKLKKYDSCNVCNYFW
jgi:hypothetical protein